MKNKEPKTSVGKVTVLPKESVGQLPGLVERITARFSKFWWISKKQKKAVDNFREVVESVEGLNRAYISHQRTEVELKDLGSILEKDRLDRQASLNESRARLKESEDRIHNAETKAELRSRSDELKKQELEAAIAKAKKDIDEASPTKKKVGIRAEHKSLLKKVEALSEVELDHQKFIKKLDDEEAKLKKSGKWTDEIGEDFDRKRNAVEILTKKFMSEQLNEFIEKKTPPD